MKDIIKVLPVTLQTICHVSYLDTNTWIAFCSNFNLPVASDWSQPSSNTVTISFN